MLQRLSSQPVFARRLSAAAGRALGPHERTWLAAFAFLHDIGKLSPSFQAKAWPGVPLPRTRSHLTEGWRWHRDLVARPQALAGAAHRLLQPFDGAPHGAWLTWWTALFAHHGRPAETCNDGRPFAPSRSYDWQAEETRMGEALNAWFPGARWDDPATFGRPELVHLFAGLLALSDWIGSDAARFPHTLAFDRAYADGAEARAQAALEAVGLEAAPWPEKAPEFARLSGHNNPRGVQSLMADVGDAPLVIVEAETGSGKTEAALWHFARLRDAGAVDALYFAVPTRAAAGQLHTRISKAMARIGGPAPVLAVPGQLKVGDVEGVRLPGFDVRWDDGGTHWAGEHATRYLAAAVAVGTVDQALMAALTVKHAPLRGAGLSRSLLVIDEVHASDEYMSAIAHRLVRDHLALGGRALLMSATLGSAARAAWLGTPAPSEADAVATPYPAVWRQGAAQPLCPSDGPERAKTVTPTLVSTMDPQETAARAVGAARAGARVLVIRNTVDAAVATFNAVVAIDPALCLTVNGLPAVHHSRFAPEDRQRLDRAVEVHFGKDAPGPSGVIAIGTQTLEQSLDIDADHLITDLCPMDVLLQRVGRLQRHDRARPPGFEGAAVTVLAPEGGLDRLAREKRFENGLGAWEARGILVGVYVDVRALEATRRAIEAGRVWTIPADNRRLVEAASHPDALAAIDTEMGWQDYTMVVTMKARAERQHGQSLTLDRSAPFPVAFPDADEVIQTRLGALGPIYALPDGTVGAFGTPITSLSPPARWCHGLTGKEDVAIEPGEPMVIMVGDRSFRYDRMGLTKSRALDKTECD